MIQPSSRRMRSSELAATDDTTPASEIVVCSVVRAELAYGAAESDAPERAADKQRRFLAPYATLPFANRDQ
jgi:tRNA(fMet)-specific endonuclease VapC